MNLAKIFLIGDVEQIKVLKAKLEVLPDDTITIKHPRGSYNLIAEMRDSAVNIYPTGGIRTIKGDGPKPAVNKRGAILEHEGTTYNIFWKKPEKIRI